MGLFDNHDPIFFYHKTPQSSTGNAFDGVVTPSAQARKDDCMKVNYPERIEDTVSELKIIMSQQRTVTNRQKVQALYLLKSGLSQSITDVF